MTTPDERPEDVLAEALRIVYGENNDRSVPLTDHQYGAAALLARLAARSYTLSKSAPDRPEPLPREALDVPVVRTSASFGDWIDFGVGGAIVIAVNDGGGLQPCEYKLSHQLYLPHLRELLAEHREVWVLPVNSHRGWIRVPAALSAREPDRPTPP